MPTSPVRGHFHLSVRQFDWLAFRSWSLNAQAPLSNHQHRLRLIDHLIAFKQSVGFHDTLKLHGVRVADIPFLSRHAMEDPCILTNPRASSMRDVEVVYAEAL